MSRKRYEEPTSGVVMCDYCDARPAVFGEKFCDEHQDIAEAEYGFEDVEEREEVMRS